MGKIIGVILVLALTCAAHAANATLGSDKDGTLFQSSTGNLSDGAGEAVYVGRSQQFDTSVQIRRGLIHFNLSSIPAGDAASIEQDSADPMLRRTTRRPPIERTSKNGTDCESGRIREHTSAEAHRVTRHQ